MDASAVANVQTALAILFGVGGTGAVTILVAAYRRLRTGKISDDESIIKRLHRELQRQEERALDAETDRDKEARDKQHWREQAWKYRLQLIGAGVVPDDMELPE